jgi:hypothetical protein
VFGPCWIRRFARERRDGRLSEHLGGVQRPLDRVLADGLAAHHQLRALPVLAALERREDTGELREDRAGRVSVGPNAPNGVYLRHGACPPPFVGMEPWMKPGTRCR